MSLEYSRSRDIFRADWLARFKHGILLENVSYIGLWRAFKQKIYNYVIQKLALSDSYLISVSNPMLKVNYLVPLNKLLRVRNDIVNFIFAFFDCLFGNWKQYMWTLDRRYKKTEIYIFWNKPKCTALTHSDPCIESDI